MSTRKISWAMAVIAALPTICAARNVPPVLTIEAPSAGQTVSQHPRGFGVTFTARFNDTEDGFGEGTRVSWSGDGGAWGYSYVNRNGYTTYSRSLQELGVFTVTAEASDSDGSLATDSVTFYTGNTLPEISIVNPVSADEYFVGVPVSFDANVLESDCYPDVSWASSNRHDAWSSSSPLGCSAVTTFGTPGLRTVTVTARDPEDPQVTVSDSVLVDVQAVPADAPPFATIVRPTVHAFTSANISNYLYGVVVDPAGGQYQAPLTLQWVIKRPSGEIIRSFEPFGLFDLTLPHIWIASEDGVGLGIASEEVEVWLYVSDISGQESADVAYLTVSGTPH